MNEGCPGKRTTEELSGDRFEGAHPVTRTGLALWLFLSGGDPLQLFSTLCSGHPDPKPPLLPAEAIQLRVGVSGCEGREAKLPLGRAGDCVFCYLASREEITCWF